MMPGLLMLGPGARRGISTVRWHDRNGNRPRFISFSQATTDNFISSDRKTETASRAEEREEKNQKTAHLARINRMCTLIKWNENSQRT